MSHVRQHVIFDLDGTLINSSESILASISRAFDESNQVLRYPLTNKVIGPPLKETLSYLSGTEDPSILKLLSDRFKKNYDEKGVLQTKVYPGISAMLSKLMRHNIYMYVVTNKRIVPTLKILDHLGWDQYFLSVFCIDSFDEFVKSKADLIKHTLEIYNIKNEVFYIGDTEEDMIASNSAKVPFVFVKWGYGSLAFSNQHFQVSKPEQILDFIMSKK